MKNPVDLFSKKTFEFFLESVNPEGLRVLEVGCGKGDFGALLVRAGADLSAIDTDEEAVDSAIRKGIRARRLGFLDFEDDLFDAIIFTRSLHHIHELAAAIKHAGLLLKKGGKLLVEEFSVHDVDLKTARWYYDMRSLLSIANLTDEVSKDVKNPLSEWEEDHLHDPPLNSAKEMSGAIEKSFSNILVKQCPYLYRSICGNLIEKPASYEIAKHIFEIENRLIKNNLILPVGIRIVANKK